LRAILIIDDKTDEREDLAARLEDTAGSARVVLFTGAESLEAGHSFERHISDWIDEIEDGISVALIACDKELGAYSELPGLSATPVSAVALEKGIPFCVYSRQAGDDAQEFARFKRLRMWDSEEITLEGLDPSDWAPQVKSLFLGFEALRVGYEALGEQRGTPPSALAEVLGRRDAESRLALYASGEQAFLKEVFTFYDPDEPNVDALYERMPRILGKWLFLSILRFPGILVNKVAAASYLNVDPAALSQKDVQARFSDARYQGPFHENELGPWWWRDGLDDLMDQAGTKDGQEYLLKQGVRVGECRDPVADEPAGFYCMLTRTPVSRENSRGDISWFPSGADLARIRKDKFEEITALIGV